MIGVIPNSMSVPLLLAIIILSQYSGSEVSTPNQRLELVSHSIALANQMKRCRKEASGS